LNNILGPEMPWSMKRDPDEALDVDPLSDSGERVSSDDDASPLPIIELSDLRLPKVKAGCNR